MTRPRLATLIFVSVTVLGFFVIAVAVGGRPGERAGNAGDSAPVLVFAEFGQLADRIYSADADDTTRRTLVTTVEHAEGWGINPAPAMAGALVAFLALPPGSRGRGAGAELWLLDVEGGERTRLARDADLFAAPVFAAGGAYLAYRAFGVDGEQRIVRYDLERRTRRIVHRYAGEFGVIPVATTDSGTTLFVELSTGGTDLLSVDGDGNVDWLLHASDEVARDWQLSPDGSRLSYLAPERTGERVLQRLHVVSMTGGDAADVSIRLATADSQQFAPVWDPAGGALTFGREPYPDATASAATLSLADGSVTALAAPERGFDAPLGWSPDGRYLAARSFDGRSAFEPGAESMVVISVDGQRHAVTAGSELIYIGWTTRG
ncbi:MAG: hypothetical protein QF664_05140 [Dehalococcoidia bacterium]|jgi:hypothetical protein|nr:hypothetical protein [Dehalococcoidia bacterium]